jgi:hypothetical protein
MIEFNIIRFSDDFVILEPPDMDKPIFLLENGILIKVKFDYFYYEDPKDTLDGLYFWVTEDPTHSFPCCDGDKWAYVNNK